MTEKTCNEPATVYYCWPGREPAPACLGCASRVKYIADAIGCHVPFIPINHTDAVHCQQKVKADG